jgi:3D (Asp-Asp-Asp) domain-containing protein
MNILSAKRLLLIILLTVTSFTAKTSFSTPNRNYNNNSIASATRGDVAKIQRELRTIEVVRLRKSMIRKVRFAKQTKSIKRLNKLKVTATAYTSHAAQTDSTPNIAAWGDKLRPGMKAIAVSRDLLKVYGLKHGTKVRIKGLSGEYLVLDKMNKRWRKRIDIYMGKNRHKAFQWGSRNVELHWSI